MEPEAQTETTLRLASDWSPVFAMGLPVVLAVVGWFLYFRESCRRPGIVGYLLPTLRSLAILLVGLVLAGPILHHEKTVRQLGRLFVLVDGSASMNLADPTMTASRKAAVLESLGELKSIPMFRSATSAELELLQASKAARKEGVDSQEKFIEVAEAFRAGIAQAAPHVRQVCGATLPRESAAGGEDLSDRGTKLLKEFSDKVDRGSSQFADEVAKKEENRWEGHAGWMRKIAEDSDRVLAEVEGLIDAYGAHLLSAETAPAKEFQAKVALFDEQTRWQRLEKQLLSPENGLLAKLAEDQDVELVILGGDEADLVWWQRRAGDQRAGDIPEQFQQVADARPSDLAGLVAEAMGGRDTLAEGAAAVIFTDGRHNAEGSPQAVAANLGQMGIPLFPVGMGAVRPPRDIALVGLSSPQSVFVEDRLFGEAQVEDNMDPGIPYQIVVRSGEKEVWSQDFQTDGKGIRRFPFEFPIKELLPGGDAGSRSNNVPLNLSVSLIEKEGRPEGVAEEFLTSNNSKPLVTQAVTQRRKVLILDGRPRWETRYIKNHFDRDEQWEATIMLGPVDSADGTRPEGIVPEDRKAWLDYDIILIGDLPDRTFSREERVWLTEFVTKKGGGLILIDGQRGHLPKYADTDLAPILPVEWKEEQRDLLPVSLRPSLEFSALGALSLSSADSEGRDDGEVWSSLFPPRWVASVDPLPAAEVLVEAELPDGKSVPAMVSQRFGAGRVLYVGTDELWRWRYREGDTFHRKFWMQIANWVGEPPFAASGEFLSIASDRLNYADGDVAALRVRLRAQDGGLLEGANAKATLWRDDKEFGQIELTEDPNGGGLYRAITSALPGGTYRVEVEGQKLAPEQVSLTFRVDDPPDQEMDALSLDRGLLSAMAAASAGGKALLEEDASELPALLKAIDRKETVTSETVLWSSWWWFLPIILLLTLEWILRKRGGFV